MIRWTLEKCLSDAAPYTKKVDYLTNNKKSYHMAYKRGWLEEVCSHMEPHSPRHRKCVYVYEFRDNHVFISSCTDLPNTDTHHLMNGISNTSPVREHMNYTGLYPVLAQLTDYIDEDDAYIMEDFYIDKYISTGWIILNKQIAGISSTVYTKEKCKEVIDKCVYLSDLNDNYARVAVICKINKWYTYEIGNLIKKRKENKYWFDKQRCHEIALMFKTQKEFSVKYRQVYNAAAQCGFLREITSHMKVKKPTGHWSYENCKEESKKYVSRTQLKLKCKGAYNSAYLNGWLDDLYPVK